MKGNDKTVLIIDDDIDFQFMITSILASNGFDVKSLLEGRIFATVDSAKNCDIILLDVELPGASGVDIGRELKAQPETSDIPIILLTGHDEAERVFQESQANVLFKKPFLLGELLNKIKELLNLDADHSNTRMGLAHG